MIKKLFVLNLLLFISYSGFAVNKCFPTKSDQKLVYDQVGVLSEAEYAEINNYLIDISNNTSNQIVIVIVDDLCGMDNSMFATELGQEWGVGRDGKDNGIVILVKPTKTNGPRTTFIAVGYGLEGVIPDATAKMIVENEMNPNFKKGNIASGLKAGLNIIVPLVKQEFNYVAYDAQTAKGKKGFPYLIIVVILFVIIFKIFSARSYARDNGISLWSAFMLGSLMNSRGGSGRGGGFGDFSSGSGGFGGFGGGGFGGGGSGGDW